MGFGLAALSEPVTYMLLGEQWKEASTVIAGFAIISTSQYLLLPLSTLLNVDGHMKIQSYIMWIEFLVFLILAFILVPIYDLKGLIYARFASSLINSGMVLVVTKKNLSINITALLNVIYRPLCGAAIMYVLIFTFLPNYESTITKLCFGLGAGSCFYITWIYITWLWTGRPDGIELTLHQKIFSKTR